MVAKCLLEVEIAMDKLPMPISVSSTHFALRYGYLNFLLGGRKNRKKMEIDFR